MGTFAGVGTVFFVFDLDLVGWDGVAGAEGSGTGSLSLTTVGVADDCIGADSSASRSS